MARVDLRPLGGRRTGESDGGAEAEFGDLDFEIGDVFVGAATVERQREVAAALGVEQAEGADGGERVFVRVEATDVEEFFETVGRGAGGVECGLDAKGAARWILLARPVASRTVRRKRAPGPPASPFHQRSQTSARRLRAIQWSETS